jgi:hypothetical protein
MNSPHLSEKIQELIPKARIVSFKSWQDTHPVAAIQRFQKADDERRYLTDEDLQLIQDLAPKASVLIPIAQLLHEKVNDIVDEARKEVLEAFPTITEPGGGLFPQERAVACWRDFWHFLRCITYGIAGGHINYTSLEGLFYMKLLYQELHVPLSAMIVGLEGIKRASLRRVDPEQAVILDPYFDHLTHHLNQFS